MDEWNQLEQALGQLIETGTAEVHENGEWLAALNGFRGEVRRQGKQAIVHLWSDEGNLVRRVLRVASCTPSRIQLEVERFGRAKPGRLEFLSARAPRQEARITREQFKARFARMLAEQFPDASVHSLTTAADLKRSFSALYTRGVMSEGASSWAIIAAGPSENSAACEGILAFGLLWLDWVRRHSELRGVQGLRVFLPQGRARVTAERIRALRRDSGAEVFEFAEADGKIRRLDPAAHGNLESWLLPRKEIENILAGAAREIEHVRKLLPAANPSIEVSVSSGTREIVFRFRGLEFARICEGQLALTLENCGNSFPESLRELARRRSAGNDNTKDSLYRAAPEHWLESAVRANPLLLEPSLDPEHLYSQVPALAGGERGVIDLLGVTRNGRLVVIELKASEDIQLPLQAVDYWLRVRRHLAEGDFQASGYFPGVELSPEPPLIRLVAPGLQFHPANETILKYLAPDLQIARIGLNESWRKGIRVTLRQ